jgi:putative transcriptional regulator
VRARGSAAKPNSPFRLRKASKLMPIRVRLDRILLDRRMSLTELADRVGVTIANLSILKTGKARAIRFSTLDALCRELDCQPGDLLSFDGGPPVDAGEEEDEGID